MTYLKTILFLYLQYIIIYDILLTCKASAMQTKFLKFERGLKMNITERIENYSRLERYDEENNDMNRVLFSDEAQADTVLEAEMLNIYAGYSELWEDGFSCDEIEDEGERKRIESKMNDIYVEKMKDLIAEFFEEGERK